MNWSERYAASTKEVKQHIKTLKNRGWNYLGITGAGHHKLNWPHAPAGQGTLTFPATPSDTRSLINSRQIAKTIESRYPAPPIVPTTPRVPSAWDVRLQTDQATADAQSQARHQETNRPLTVQERMRQKRQQRYDEQ